MLEQTGLRSLGLGEEVEASSSLELGCCFSSCLHHRYDVNIVPWHFATAPLTGIKKSSSSVAAHRAFLASWW